MDEKRQEPKDNVNRQGNVGVLVVRERQVRERQIQRSVDGPQMGPPDGFVVDLASSGS